ncbi:unnamed protein product [Callosobruchus maculatus]|uniref:Uncharacterized protein n=1 Tax=Callosobruchus maculatus TaxID=64391 RepID=A0A653CF90_CALMS|nr:unnamed protein product [Callosobruchus maculatus]
MDHSYKLQHNVTFMATDQRYTLDPGDELESDDETHNHSKSSGPIRSAGDMAQSVSSISTSILDDGEEIRALKDKLATMELKYKVLECEMEKTNISLTNEKTKNAKLEKKLQFVKDNQEVFMRLKEAYINMKYNEAAGRKMIEIREKGIQTWEGILCRSCIETEQVRRQIESVKEEYKNSLILSASEMMRMMNTVKYLKDLIERREKSWGLNMERDEKMRTSIAVLQDENMTLRKLLQQRPVSTTTVEDKPPAEEITVAALSDAQLQELTQLKKIIIKFEKRFRELQQANGEMSKLAPAFNEKELKLINQLMTRYYSRRNARSMTRNQSRDTQNCHSVTRSIRSPRSASRKSIRSRKDYSEKTEGDPDTAMFLMDYLFESDTAH